MRDIPIIFSASMVRALLREAQEPGTGKSMTRRLAKTTRVKCNPKNGHFSHNEVIASPWQRVKPGDRLWVRENFWHYGRWTHLEGTEDVVWTDECSPAKTPNRIHAADADPEKIKPRGANVMWEQGWYLKPSIHMPRTMSRLTLVVTETKVERLQDISEQDCEREGLWRENVGPTWVYAASEDAKWQFENPRDAFINLWLSIHGNEAWTANPEVIALTFKVHAANVDAMRVAA